MPDISEISTCTNKEVKFWLSTITMLKYSPLVPLILFKLRANYSCVKGLTRPNQQNETQFDDFFRLLFSFSVYFNFSVFIDSLTCDLSVDETFLSFFCFLLLRKFCYVHNATHQHLACDEKHDDFIIFLWCFLKKLFIANFYSIFFFTFLCCCCLEVEHITHQSS